MKKMADWIKPTRIITRWQAAAVHFTFSLFIFITITVLILSFWYPGSYFWLGGLKAIALIAGVDLVLGPVLTLIVYNINKKSLPIDLTLIGVIQLSALTFGLWTIHQARPVLQIQSYDKVYVLTNEEIQSFKISVAALENFRTQIPIKVYLELPDEPESIEQIELVTAITENKPLAAREDLFRNYPHTAFIKKYKLNQQNQCLQIPLVYLGLQQTICLYLENGNFTLADIQK